MEPGKETNMIKEFVVMRDIFGNIYSQTKLVRCKACGDCREDGYCERWQICVRPDFFCADGDDGNLQEGS